MPMHRYLRYGRMAVAIAGVALAMTGRADAQVQTIDVTATSAKPRLEIYGFAMMDMGFDFKQNAPEWFDVVRPTKLPAFPNEYGEDERFYSGVRQSRLGAKTFFETPLGELRTTFEFELFGTGVDAGQTTFRLRHAYGELGAFGAGQTWSPFMDIDVFPNSIEYWGPNGMAFFRNVQVRWMPIRGDTRLTLALERPGASADQGTLESRIELDNVAGRFPLPDFSGEYRLGGKWGYVEGAGILRRFDIDDTRDDAFDFDQSITGWGINLSSNIKAGSAATLRLSWVFGEGIQNYMNDAPVDVAIEANPDGGLISPIQGTALPMNGAVAFLDINWSEKWSTAVGYSMLDIDNTEFQTPDAFHKGEYALVNLLHYPIKNVMAGAEFQWGKRKNFADGFESDDYRIQFSFRYNFNVSIGGQ
jgi:hypothetical protein